jgi:predicted SnoaL-like aldol condensation-catalyzing enzyme
MSIKDIFLEAFARFAAGDVDVLDEIIGPDFVNHAPDAPHDRDAWIQSVKTGPLTTSTVDIKRVIADDEFVVVHYQLIPPEGGLGEAVVDIWRFAGDVIVEHWDVSQPVTDPDQV